ncbi:hypothetical protein LY76DRAFT_184981 [Colletotrichum caudatum]|nr:hypothetical protein LY76DRAFT_184981 [Colletotrichum caudatum]
MYSVCGGRPTKGFPLRLLVKQSFDIRPRKALDEPDRPCPRSAPSQPGVEQVSPVGREHDRRQVDRFLWLRLIATLLGRQPPLPAFLPPSIADSASTSHVPHHVRPGRRGKPSLKPGCPSPSSPVSVTPPSPERPKHTPQPTKINESFEMAGPPPHHDPHPRASIPRGGCSQPKPNWPVGPMARRLPTIPQRPPSKSPLGHSSGMRCNRRPSGDSGFDPPGWSSLLFLLRDVAYSSLPSFYQATRSGLDLLPCVLRRPSIEPSSITHQPGFCRHPPLSEFAPTREP